MRVSFLLVDVETVAVLRKRWLAGTITAQRFADAVRDLEDLGFDWYPTLSFMPAWELRANLTAYDAAYVALAETLGCELFTATNGWRSPRGHAAPSAYCAENRWSVSGLARCDLMRRIRERRASQDARQGVLTLPALAQFRSEQNLQVKLAVHGPGKER